MISMKSHTCMPAGEAGGPARHRLPACASGRLRRARQVRCVSAYAHDYLKAGASDPDRRNRGAFHRYSRNRR